MISSNIRLFYSRVYVSIITQKIHPWLKVIYLLLFPQAHMISSNRMDDVCGHKMLSIEELYTSTTPIITHVSTCVRKFVQESVFTSMCLCFEA